MVGEALSRLSPASYTIFLGHVIVIQMTWWGWQELVGFSRHDSAWWTFFGLAVFLSAATLASFWWIYDRLRAALRDRSHKPA